MIIIFELRIFSRIYNCFTSIFWNSVNLNKFSHCGTIKKTCRANSYLWHQQRCWRLLIYCSAIQLCFYPGICIYWNVRMRSFFHCHSTYGMFCFFQFQPKRKNKKLVYNNFNFAITTSAVLLLFVNFCSANSKHGDMEKILNISVISH